MTEFRWIKGDKMNLLKETKKSLRQAGYTLDDIKAIQGNALRISVDRFVTLADVYYGKSLTESPEVAVDLVIIMKDGSFFTRAYNAGFEWWRHVKTPVVLPEITDDKVESLVRGPGCIGVWDLEDIQG